MLDVSGDALGIITRNFIIFDKFSQKMTKFMIS